jgi:acyl-CoA reductase-like NAD-dependent aldehyde dehydrogenase
MFVLSGQGCICLKRLYIHEVFRGDVSANGKGFFFPVTLLDNPPEDASFVAHEIFGPIRSVFKYKTVDEAIRRANNTSYGLEPQSGGKIQTNFNE